MHSKTLISMVIILAAVLCSKPVVSDILTDTQKWELAYKLNILVRHSGWRFMDDIKLLKKKRKQVVDPMSEILEAMSSNVEPVNESNVLERHMDIWAVLMCKYADVILSYKNLMKFFIRFCKGEKNPNDGYQRYYNCFESLLTNIHNVSPRIQRMMDAMDFMYSIGPQSNHKYLLPGMQKLIDYTSTIRLRTLANMSTSGTRLNVIDVVLNTIGGYLTEMYIKNIYWYTLGHCNVPKTGKWTVPIVKDQFVHAKSYQRIPHETTLLQFVEKQIDDYVNDTMSKWFDDLGFTYGADGKVTVRTN